MDHSKNKPTYDELEANLLERDAQLSGLLGEALKLRQVEEALHKRTHDLGERVKELNCLYAIYTLSEQRDISIDEILRATAELIPPAWQYPEITCACIEHRGVEFRTASFSRTGWMQASDIFVRGERAGSIEVFYTQKMPDIDEGPFLKEERNLIKGIAEQLGLIIERVLTDEALRESEKRLHALSQNVISAQEEERARLSRELHDELGHQLATLRLELDWIMRHGEGALDKGNLDTLLVLVGNATAQLRRICKGLRPMIPDFESLGLAIETLVADFQAHSEIEIELSISPMDDCEFNPDIAINVYRVLQEMFTNISRHSGASRVEVRFGPQDSDIVLDVRDDGCGFQDASPESDAGLGIIGMRERATLCGGSLEIKSWRGRGTRATMRVPAQMCGGLA